MAYSVIMIEVYVTVVKISTIVVPPATSADWGKVTVNGIMSARMVSHVDFQTTAVYSIHLQNGIMTAAFQVRLL